MTINIDLVKQLREETGISLGDCKKALESSNGDMAGAKEYLKKRGQDVAAKKTEREVGAGIVDVYVHSNKRLGVMLELNCETDFVARSEDFQNLAHEICLQIAAIRPVYVREEEVTEATLNDEKTRINEQEPGISEEVINIKLEEYKKSICLLSQPWMKDGEKTMQVMINECIAKTGENIVVKRFVIYEF